MENIIRLSRGSGTITNSTLNGGTQNAGGEGGPNARKIIDLNLMLGIFSTLT